jgi:hypothetical protein
LEFVKSYYFIKKSKMKYEKIKPSMAENRP